MQPPIEPLQPGQCDQCGDFIPCDCETGIMTTTPTDDEALVERAREIVAAVFDAKADALERAPLPNGAAVRIVRVQAEAYRRGKSDGTEQMKIALAALTPAQPVED